MTDQNTADSPLRVRPYLLTGGRTRSSVDLAIEAQISCFPRSSHPAEPEGSATPGLEADWTDSIDDGFGAVGGLEATELKLVERLSGSVRSLSTVPAAAED